MHRIPTLLLAALCIVSLACQRADGGWRGSVEERNGVQVVSNEGPGVEHGSVRERVRPLWTTPTRGMSIWADFDPAGNVYVLDYAAQSVMKLSRDGRPLGEFAGPGQESGTLSKSRRFAYANDRLYVANTGNGRIEVLGTSGEIHPPIELASLKQPEEIYYTNQQFFVSRRLVPRGPFVYAFDGSFAPRGELRQSAPAADTVDRLSSMNTVCTAPDGLWIVYNVQNRIEKVGWDGKVLLETSRELDDRWPFRKDEKGRILPEIIVNRDCAVDRDGNLYVISSNPANWKQANEVYKFGPDGRLRQLAFTLPVFNATMIRFDPQGNFYYSDGKTVTKAKLERTIAQ